MIRELAEKIIDTIYDVVAIVDGDLNISDTNSAVASLGYAEEDLLGKPLLNLFDKKDWVNIKSVFPELISRSAGGERKVVRFEAVRKDGSRLWVDITASAIDATPVVDYLVTIRDVDERAKTRIELEDQKKRLEAVLTELRLANDQLEKRQAVTEAALAKEQEYNLATQKTGYQRAILQWMIVLIAFVFALPYLSSIVFQYDPNNFFQKAVEGSVNNMPLLIQILGIGFGAMFGAQAVDKAKKNE